jgi:betaine reductase
MCGCVSASGMDVKNFCAGPASALVTAGALVKSGIYKRVAVVAGGSLAKLGMKFQAFLKTGMPVLDDCLGAMAILVTPDDGVSPVLHLEPGTIGNASIGASTSDEAVYRELILEPLKVLGLGMADIDKYAPELHNPEIMEHAGSGDVVHKNYRLIAAIAVLADQITKAEMPAFVEKIGMVGFAPTQGHIPSAIPFLGHAMQAMRNGAMRRAMFLCKASLFLNRVTELYDGVSFVVEANPRAGS